MKLNINFNILDKQLKQIENLERDLTRGNELWRNMVKVLQFRIAQQWDREIGFVDNRQVKWPHYYKTFTKREDAEGYIAYKEKKHPGSGNKLLEFSGRGKRSLTSRNSYSIRVMRPDKLIFGTRAKWMKYHNWQSRLGRNKGWRPFFRRNRWFTNDLDEAAEEFAKEKIRRYYR